MAFDFSIKIKGKLGQPAQFVPQGGKPGYPLTVKANDTVSWGNKTGEDHQPWPTDAQHNPMPPPPNPSLSDPIPAGQPSTPAFTVTGPARTIHYRCSLHPDREEFGQIIVVA